MKQRPTFRSCDIKPQISCFLFESNSSVKVTFLDEGNL